MRQPSFAIQHVVVHGCRRCVGHHVGVELQVGVNVRAFVGKTQVVLFGQQQLNLRCKRGEFDRVLSALNRCPSIAASICSKTMQRCAIPNFNRDILFCMNLDHLASPNHSVIHRISNAIAAVDSVRILVNCAFCIIKNRITSRCNKCGIFANIISWHRYDIQRKHAPLAATCIKHVHEVVLISLKRSDDGTVGLHRVDICE
mmetsp:Transcript_4935/g.14304  ORF Transcript_4935/g.14304 Transcript_4935/m.14304 type:complete len:201 (-) Transcript_4935:4910-5512(-)